MTELTDLVGLHTLEGVDMTLETYKPYDWSGDVTVNVCLFRMDGVTYKVMEDESDGYRSSMRSLEVSDEAVTNTFPPIQVLGKHRTSGRYSGTDDVLELIDVATGQVVLEVGTDNVDDYYPGFVASFRPENMATNTKS